MKKKLVALLLSAAMGVSLLAGCGSSDEEETKETVTEESEETTAGASEEGTVSVEEEKPTETIESDAEDEGAAADTKSAPAAGSGQRTSEGDTWTILVYLCGTNLESDGGGDASYNLLEMMAADQSDKINLVIETGGTKDWAMNNYDTDGFVDEIKSDRLQRFVISPDGMRVVDEEPLAAMNDESTFADFMQWGVKNYPADKYMTILWDHGGGSVGGVICDELFDDNESLTVKEVAEGIKSSGATFEVVGFDACLMSTLETAAALAPCAKYLVASEEVEPGTGWSYTAWLDYLADDPSISGDELGMEIVDSFFDKCDENDIADDCTLAVTDLDKIPHLVECFNNMAEEMKSCADDTGRIKGITGAFKSSMNYGGNNDDEGYTEMMDLGDFILNTEGVLNETGDAVIDALTDAVVYHKDGDSRQKSEGLSIYAPLSGDEYYFDTYVYSAAFSGEYLAFIEELYNFEELDDVSLMVPVWTDDNEIVDADVNLDYITPAATIEGRDLEITYEAKINDDGYMQVDIVTGADIIDGAKCNLYYYDETDDMYYCLGSDYTLNISDDFTEFTDNFDNTWVAINGYFCPLKPVAIDENYVTYSVPCLVNDEKTNLRMQYSQETGEYEVIGLWDGIDENGMPSREYGQLKDGDEVDFLMDAKYDSSSEPEETAFMGFTVDGPLEIYEADLGDGYYAYSMIFDDIFGNSTETKWAYIVVEGDDMWFEMEE